MPYVTMFLSPRTHQLTLEEILKGEVKILPQPTHRSTTSTITRFIETPSPQMLRQYNIAALKSKIVTFNRYYQHLHEADRHSLYHSFRIPKRSGGLRQIDQPNEELMKALRELVSIFRNDFCALYHTAAFAYVKGRSTIDSVKKHQMHRSRWFLKIDFENFFGSTTLKFLMSMLEKIFPFSEVMRDDEGRMELTRAVSLCFLDDGLPQGTPASPMLTNLMMIPIDYEISKSLTPDGFIYTRYADDSLISHSRSFMFTDMCRRIEEILGKFQAPFAIKKTKTRYGSSAGANWNLGVMLNKDNEITIGHQKKKIYKSMICNYLQDRRDGTSWSLEDIRHLMGLTAYYRMVEPHCIDEIIAKYNQKFGTDFMRCMRSDLA